MNIKIKIEIDTAPPQGFLTEEKLLLKPFSFYVRCYQLPDLFAGKMHALLFRKWKQRVKGRDWYDMEWYIRKGVRFNKKHFIQRALDSNDLSITEISNAEFLQLLREKIEATSIDAVREDVIRFIDDEDKVLSMPPIINSHDTGKISENTKDIFIECSGFNLEYLKKTITIWLFLKLKKICLT
jgi:hypothetical protein